MYTYSKSGHKKSKTFKNDFNILMRYLINIHVYKINNHLYFAGYLSDDNQPFKSPYKEQKK